MLRQNHRRDPRHPLHRCPVRSTVGVMSRHGVAERKAAQAVVAVAVVGLQAYSTEEAESDIGRAPSWLPRRSAAGRRRR